MSQMRSVGASFAGPNRIQRDVEPPADGGMPGWGDSAYQGRTDPRARGQAAALPYGVAYQPGTHGSGYPPHPLLGMSRLFTQMFLMWRDLLGPLVPSDGRWHPEAADSPPQREADYGFPQEADGAASRKAASSTARDRARVTFDISTAKSVEVSLTLDLEQDLAALAVLDLVAVSDAAERGAPGQARRPPAIQDVVIERTAEDDVVVRLTVPAEQPPGTYLGMIVDRTRAEPRGDVRVRVHA